MNFLHQITPVMIVALIHLYPIVTGKEKRVEYISILNPFYEPLRKIFNDSRDSLCTFEYIATGNDTR